MKITIYELLGLIKDGKAPKKIATQGYTFELIENTDTIRDIYVDEDGEGLFSEYYWGLEDEVKILDEEDEFIDIEKPTLLITENNDFAMSETLNDKNFKEINIALCNLIKNQKKIINKLKEEGK